MSFEQMIEKSLSSLKKLAKLRRDNPESFAKVQQEIEELRMVEEQQLCVQCKQAPRTWENLCEACAEGGEEASDPSLFSPGRGLGE